RRRIGSEREHDQGSSQFGDAQNGRPVDRRAGAHVRRDRRTIDAPHKCLLSTSSNRLCRGSPYVLKPWPTVIAELSWGGAVSKTSITPKPTPTSPHTPLPPDPSKPN